MKACGSKSLAPSAVHNRFHDRLVNPDPAYGIIVHRCCFSLRREQSGVYERCSAPTASSDDGNHEERLDQMATPSSLPRPPEPQV